MFQQRCNMFPSDSQLRSFLTLFMARAGSAVCVIIGKMATATQRQDKTIISKQQKTHILIRPGYIYHPNHIRNPHECDMIAEIGLSKTQSQESCSIQPHSQSTPFCTHCRIQVKSKEMASEPRAEMKPAILSTTANLGRSGE